MNNSRSSLEKPNFLFLLVDEERYPPVYENSEIKEWRKRNLIAQERLRSHGLEFHRHYIGSTACSPSRTTIFTGQYPSLHGVSQTTGIAKRVFDSDMHWLDRNTVPTMGDYFREAGYLTSYRGKWHISYEDIVIPGTHNGLISYNPVTGVPDLQREALYKHADRLDSFGFNGWIGPEPHGRNPRNSASSASIGLRGRDEVYAAEAVRLIESLDRQCMQGGNVPPWLIVASFVNPHDIVLYGDLAARLPEFRFDVEPMPEVAPPPTLDESLAAKPRCQTSYRELYPKAMQPITDQAHYRKLYFQLQKNADWQMNRVFEALTRSSFYDNTIVIFTSDHGDLLGAHGRQFQKMYSAYEEIVHVPLVIHNRHLFPRHIDCQALTSHMDLLPTMLGLANADTEEIQVRLRSRFSEVHPFVGRNLAPYVRGRNGAGIDDEPVYFMTDDDITRGQHQVSPLGIAYSSVIQPNHIETVIMSIMRNGKKELWKYSRYFDNVQFWSQPGVQDVTVHPVDGEGAKEGQLTGWVTTVKTQPVQDEYELYNLSEDPLETRNFAYTNVTEYSLGIQRQMMKLLDEQRARKRLYPRHR
ncbi:sulfatase-like hydrolase/transferase [Cohnella herbarum]|uniref:Sulfatase-like hydrolase/transferase n=1 Tax=Cohnella herbarum TaxID=2728023 RepID=A0A7Z2VMC3_9BACL|nr:sulfatase-like hydrolase/transferase [Cohnella herbarum]QJD85574.1 sulfatase-like hydrolase/transferase [Cohnella herbarum]